MWIVRSVVTVVLVMAGIAHADLTIPGADGSDGDLILSPGTSATIDLAQAASGPGIRWDTPSPDPGKGVYDPEKWAVVFKYSSVHLQDSYYQQTQLYFTNHSSGAPVVWLVSGDVVIDARATIFLNGGGPAGPVFSWGGPGGFRGGRGDSGTPGSGGMGPGGGNTTSDGNRGSGSFGTSGGLSGASVPAAPTYANWLILPLIGGSGGGRYGTNGGSAGGGAILIAATGTITVNGAIYADGGDTLNSWNVQGAGSGGAIRLVADVVTGAGGLFARGGAGSNNGGKGRICVQANQITLQQVGDPPLAAQTPILQPLLIWLPSTAPTIKPVSIVANGQTIPIPDDPRANFSFNLADVQFTTGDAVTLNIAAQNVPLNWPVVVRVVPKDGPTFSVMAAALQGSLESSTTSAQLSLARGIGAIQVRAYKPAE